MQQTRATIRRGHKDLLPKFNLTPWGLRLYWGTHQVWAYAPSYFPLSSDHKDRARAT
jgi:hypothetical protein